MRVLAELPLRQALPWPVLLDYLQPRLIPLLERIADGAYERRVGEDWLRIAPSADGQQLQIAAEKRIAVAGLATRAARLFAVEEDTAPALKALSRSAVLKPLVKRMPGLRPPGCWDPFELCLRTIIGQQVSVAAAGTLMRRLIERCGTLAPEALLAADLEQMGMPGRRVETLRVLARAVGDGLRLDGSWEEINAGLSTLPGFGPWTRGYLAIRLGRQPDAFPHTDLGLVRAAGAENPAALLLQAEAWRPHRSLAATLLWAG
ncbi:DNA-3-methyladenine glycosylase 2 family protein [Solimonas sp. K1W22B-7]|uniref:DNA-3-methyladenine glycosylase family protein n=1 Tax=Solimonas sp. K1W22B-7 TaxID=2303331 RepID=UPI000E3365DD|nr:AlkA N-terminal domain-containing protein [Solimonas sp. K1W22B-7]AXQ28110.1 DNA-3-methyladenine glycosylase 2 family protein [Solimonas sp. K1W22B-7]